VLRDGTAVGGTTSGTFSPSLRVGVALAYLDPSLAPGDRVTIQVRRTQVDAEVTRPPFLDRNPRA
jgi:aminomethyltransferase